MPLVLYFWCYKSYLDTDTTTTTTSLLGGTSNNEGPSLLCAMGTPNSGESTTRARFVIISQNTIGDISVTTQNKSCSWRVYLRELVRIIVLASCHLHHSLRCVSSPSSLRSVRHTLPNSLAIDMPRIRGGGNGASGPQSSASLRDSTVSIAYWKKSLGW